MVGDAVALVSIGSGAAVAVAVPYFSARLERAKLRFQTQAARLDELRSRLDEGVVALSLVEHALGTAALDIERAKNTKATDSDRHAAKASMESLREAIDRVERSSQLLAIRLGSRSSVVGAYEAARNSLRELECWGESILASGPASDDPAGYAEAARGFAQLRETSVQRKQQFVDAASSILGPDTGSEPTKADHNNPRPPAAAWGALWLPLFVSLILAFLIGIMKAIGFELAVAAGFGIGATLLFTAALAGVDPKLKDTSTQTSLVRAGAAISLGAADGAFLTSDASRYSSWAGLAAGVVLIVYIGVRK